MGRNLAFKIITASSAIIITACLVHQRQANSKKDFLPSTKKISITPESIVANFVEIETLLKTQKAEAIILYDDKGKGSDLTSLSLLHIRQYQNLLAQPEFFSSSKSETLIPHFLPEQIYSLNFIFSEKTFFFPVHSMSKKDKTQLSKALGESYQYKARKTYLDSTKRGNITPEHTKTAVALKPIRFKEEFISTSKYIPIEPEKELKPSSTLKITRDNFDEELKKVYQNIGAKKELTKGFIITQKDKLIKIKERHDFISSSKLIHITPSRAMFEDPPKEIHFQFKGKKAKTIFVDRLSLDQKEKLDPLLSRLHVHLKKKPNKK